MRGLTRRYFCLLVALQLTACAAGVRLSDADRTELRRQSVVHVVHYESRLPRIETNNKAAPSPNAIRRHAAADPAALVAKNFSLLLAKKENLKNLRVEPGQRPLPVVRDATAYREKFANGLVLELWTDAWTFATLPTDATTYTMSLSMRSRLARTDNGRVLWSTGRCRVDGTSAGREQRLLHAELTSGTKLRKVLMAARDECARQLTRDYAVRNP